MNATPKPPKPRTVLEWYAQQLPKYLAQQAAKQPAAPKPNAAD